MTHATEPVADAAETAPDLSAFLPLRVAPSLVGLSHIVDARGATFLDRAFQLRGFPKRPDFKDEFDSLAPQIVERINSFDQLSEAAHVALDALNAVRWVSLPAHAREAVGKACAALTIATGGK